MKFISWNVNGLRACMGKGFPEVFADLNADFFCLQETKLQAGQIDLELPGYRQYWCYAEKKGYSGTAIFAKHEPLSVSYGVGTPELDTEGRMITLEYENFYLVTCYIPQCPAGTGPDRPSAEMGRGLPRQADGAGPEEAGHRLR